MITNKRHFLSFIILLSIVFVNCSSMPKFVYWKDFSTDEQKRIINDKSINSLAKSIYYREAAICDNNESFNLLEDLTSFIHKKKINAFYYHVWTIICQSSDGVVAEGLGYYCLNELINATEYNLQYLMHDSVLMQKYAEYIGYELSQNKDSFSKYNLVKKRINDICKDNYELKDVSCSLLNLVEERYSSSL